jgi:hypothetical protein
LTAFFVESFVTKLEDGVEGSHDPLTTVQKARDFGIVTAEKTGVKHGSVRRISSDISNSLQRTEQDNQSDRGEDADSEGSSSSDMYEFDVYEREGFDKIMQTVGGVSQQDDFARHICNYLEIFESLSPGRDPVGYLVCDQHSLERFGNRRFQTKATGFLEENELHVVVSDMHSELLALSARASFKIERALIRTFPHKRDPTTLLEISASLLRRHPALTLFVSRTIDVPQSTVPE